MNAFVDLQQISGKEIFSLIKKVEEYKKLQSYLVLYYLGLPVLKGFIITNWTKETAYELKKVFLRYGWENAMLRSDCSRNVSKKPPGGFLYSEKEIPDLVRRVLQDDRTPFLLEPVSRFDDLYSGNVLFDSDSEVLLWEVVGPGFDLSDINRGEIEPHETFLTYKGENVQDWKNLSPLDVPNHTIIPRNKYHRSWESRMIKIAKIAENKLNANNKLLNVKEPIKRAESFLQRTGHTLLLEAKKGYVPLGYNNLCHVYSLLADLPHKITNLGIASPNKFSVAFGILISRGLIFWDYFSASSFNK